MYRLTTAALIAAAAGILIQFLVGVPGFPAVPPGPIILTVTAVAVYALRNRWRWVIVLGVLVPLFIIVGGIIDGTSWGRLADPSAFGPFIGTALQWIAMPVAVIAAALTIRTQGIRKPEPAR
jgi:hypothetical protein